MTSRPTVFVDRLGKRLTSDLVEARRQGIMDIAADLRGSAALGRGSLRTTEFWALRDISFEVQPGEALGVLGPNGAGKSTLLRILHGVSRPSRGEVQIRGRHAAMLNLGAPFSKVLSGFENITVSAAIHGVPRRELPSLIDAVGEFSELPGDVLAAPMTTYSTGMQLRLGYAIAALLPADLLLVDEVIAVGDLAFQRKCLAHIRRFLGEGGSVVLVTHDLWMVQALCERAVLIDHGRIEVEGETNHVLSAYLRQARQAQTFVPRDRSAVPREGATTKVEIIDLRALDEGDVHNGDDIVVSLRVLDADPGLRVTWRIDLLTSNQQACIARVRPSGERSTVDLIDGRGAITYRIRALPLLPGTYFVAAHLHDPITGEEIGQHSEAVPLEVMSRHTRLDTLAQLPGAGGLSTVDAAYSVDP